MDAERLRNIPIQTTFQFGDAAEDKVHLVYRAGALDKAFWDWFYGENEATIFEALARVLIETGITVNGEPVPPTADALQAVITGQGARAIFRHIQEEYRAGKLRATS